MPARTGRPWQRVKRRVLERDNGVCHICGGVGADSADHIVPVAHGGDIYDLDNLAAVHHNTGPRCNRIRGAGSVEAVRQKVVPPASGWDW